MNRIEGNTGSNVSSGLLHGNSPTGRNVAVIFDAPCPNDASLAAGDDQALEAYTWKELMLATPLFGPSITLLGLAFPVAVRSRCDRTESSRSDAWRAPDISGSLTGAFTECPKELERKSLLPKTDSERRPVG